MTMRTLNALPIVALTLVLVAPSIALADDKKPASTNGTPTESIGLNWTKIEQARHGTTGPTKPGPPKPVGRQHH
jgi:hypothetical protein